MSMQSLTYCFIQLPWIISRETNSRGKENRLILLPGKPRKKKQIPDVLVAHAIKAKVKQGRKSRDETGSSTCCANWLRSFLKSAQERLINFNRVCRSLVEAAWLFVGMFQKVKLFVNCLFSIFFRGRGSFLKIQSSIKCDFLIVLIILNERIY